MAGFIEFVKGAFSDGGDPSSSRIISAVCALAVIAWGTHVVVHTHALPDPVALTAATAFSTSHYVANRITTAFGKTGQ
jgi:hypothetical protein